MTNENILGCYVSSTIGDDCGPNFREYVYGEKKLVEILKVLKYEDYGKDLKLILFQFYVNPIPYMLQHLKPIENYRKNEKSIGIPIIVNNENFFCKSETDRYAFLKESILQKLDLLGEVVKNKKLDTNLDLLKSNLKNVFKTL